MQDYGLWIGGQASDAGTEVYKPPAKYSSTLRGDRFAMALVFYEIFTGALPERKWTPIGKVVDPASYKALDDAVQDARGGAQVAEIIKDMLDVENSCTAADIKKRIGKIRKQVQSKAYEAAQE